MAGDAQRRWLTGGTFGINNIARRGFWASRTQSRYCYFILGTTIVLGAVVVLFSSPWGKAYRAARRPIRAESS